MSLSSRKNKEHAAQLAEAMKMIRLDRRMRTSDVARAMGVSLRTYERLEAGFGPFTFERIVAFAKATNSDPLALVMVLPLAKPEFALWCADNKLVSLMMLAADDLARELGPDIGFLNGHTIINAFARSARELIDHFKARDIFAEQWLNSRKDRFAGGLLPTPRGLRPRKAD